MHRLPNGFLVCHWLERSHAMRAWHLRCRCKPARVCKMRRGPLPRCLRIDRVQDLRNRQLLPSRRVGAAAVRRRHLLERVWPWRCVRVHRVPKRQFVRDWLDGSRAVCARHDQPRNWRELVHELRRRQVSGRRRLDGLQAVRDRLVLPDRGVRAAAVRGRQLQLPHRLVERRAVHELDARIFQPDGLEQLDALRGRHVHGRVGCWLVHQVSCRLVPGSGGRRDVQALQRRQLLSRGGIGRAAVPRRLVLERGESDEFERVHHLSCWQRLRDGVDGSRAVRSGHVRSDHTPIRVRDVRRGRVSGRIGLDGLQGLPGRLILPSWRVGTAAVLSWHLLEQPQSAQRR